MLYSNLVKRLSLPVLVLVVALALSGTVYAQYTSTNYKANEVFFGSGGDPNQSSANYNAKTSLGGGFASGFTSSSAYQAYSGFLSPNEPFLELAIDSGSVNLGTLIAGTTATGTALFHVRAYVDSGYTVQSMSQAPTYTSGAGSHTLTPINPTAPSNSSKEQFGINLVSNTSPATFGTNPVNQPTNAYAFGQAATGYSTGNQYKYLAGDIIACSGSGGVCGNTSGWGRTDYTISYIANTTLVTPAGSYVMVQDLVVVATY